MYNSDIKRCFSLLLAALMAFGVLSTGVLSIAARAEEQTAVVHIRPGEGIETLTAAVGTLTENCIRGITANADRCRSLLESSVGVITAVCPYIGYKQAADIAKEALRTNTPIRKLLLDKNLMDEDTIAKILDPATMA